MARGSSSRGRAGQLAFCMRIPEHEIVRGPEKRGGGFHGGDGGDPRSVRARGRRGDVRRRCRRFCRLTAARFLLRTHFDGEAAGRCVRRFRQRCWRRLWTGCALTAGRGRGAVLPRRARFGGSICPARVELRDPAQLARRFDHAPGRAGRPDIPGAPAERAMCGGMGILALCAPDIPGAPAERAISPACADRARRRRRSAVGSAAGGIKAGARGARVLRVRICRFRCRRHKSRGTRRASSPSTNMSVPLQEA